MKISMSIPCGIGDFIMIRSYFDTIKNNYEEIRLSPSHEILSTWRNNDPNYCNFLNEIGKVIFNEHPYAFDNVSRELKWQTFIIDEFKITPVKPDLSHLLCRGTLLNIDEPYIVITTKIRFLSKYVFYALAPKFWETLSALSKKYKIVILGERILEQTKEYQIKENIDQIYCIYKDIISNIPTDRVLDLTIPSLGITVPQIDKIQQDCLIMNQASFVITIGVGGNFCMAIATASKIIGYRQDNERVVDIIFGTESEQAIITRDWQRFIYALEQQL